LTYNPGEHVTDESTPDLGEKDGPPATDSEKIERLHAIAAEMMACRTERDVYQLTVAAAEGVLAFDICGIDAVEDGWFVPKAVSAELADVGYQRSAVEDGGLAGEAYRAGESKVTGDVEDSQAADPATEEYRSGLTVPVGDIGVFQAAAREPAAFDDGDRELAELLLAHTEEALRRIRFESALQERNRTIEQLHETAAELVGCEREEEVYDLVVEAVEEVLEFRVCVVLSAVEDGNALEIVAATDDEIAPEPGGRAEPDDTKVFWRTYERGESVLIEDVAEADRADPHHEAYQSAVSVPMGDVGVLQAIATEPAAFDDGDRELAELLASQAGEVVSRLRAERRRLEERDRLAALFRNVPDPAVSLGFDGDRAVIQAVNPAFEDVFGYAEDDAVGEDIDELVAPADEREDARAVNRSARRGESFHTETTRRTADGELREFLLHVVPVERSPGNPGAYAIYTDITDRKRREQRLGALHESARDLMAADDATDVCECAVAAASDTLGLPVTGVHLLEDGRLEPVAWTDATGELFDGPPPTYDADDEDVWGAFADGEGRVFTDVSSENVEQSVAIESVLVIPLGDWGVFISVARSTDAFDDQVVDLAGVLAATVETALDRTGRERTLRERERELRRQNERLEEFASVVSHDLRNPLSVAQGNLDLAAQTGEEAFFEKVETAQDRMESLIEDLLALARGGQVTGEPEPVSLPEVARRAWSTVDAPVAALDVGGDADLEADVDRLVQLLENLFANAVEHGAADADVVVAPTDRGFFVADDGSGIPEEHRDEVMAYGYSTAEEGTGLGLAIVREIAEAHGWTVEVGESADGGARFDIVIA
jgi:PAS domain S-box-containing protein